MNICVLLKQTFDTEEKITLLDHGEIAEDGVKRIINPYDEYALEEAIRLKEEHGGSVTVVSVGPERAVEALRTALAMGADEAALLADERIGGDEHAISVALAAYLKQGTYDLLMGGSFSIDSGGGQVAVRVAQSLGWAHVGSITKMTLSGQTAVVVRDAEGDTETAEVALPALFTAQQGLNEPRYPSLPGIMKAKKKPLRRLTMEDLGLSAADVSPRTERVSLALPPVRQAGRKLTGSPAEQAAELVRLLQEEAKVNLTQG